MDQNTNSGVVSEEVVVAADETVVEGAVEEGTVEAPAVAEEVAEEAEAPAAEVVEEEKEEAAA